MDKLQEREIAFLRSRGIGALACRGTDATVAWKQAFDLVWGNQLAAAEAVISSLIGAAIRPVTFKSIELCRRFWGTSALDVCADIDLIVPRNQMGEAKSILYGLGYRQAAYDAEVGELVDQDVVEIAKMEALHYELAPFVKAVEFSDLALAKIVAEARPRGPVYVHGDRAIMVMKFDIHHNVASDTDIDQILKRAVPSSWSDAHTLSATDHLWVNLSRNYVEAALHGRTSLRPLAYTLPLIARDKIDWEYLLTIADEMELGSTIYYPIATCEHLLPGTVPPFVLDTLRRSPHRILRDWGWQISQAFGFDDPFPTEILVDA